MFDKEYEFKGKHARYVRELCGENPKFPAIFGTFVDVYMVAPIIGTIYRRVAIVDKEKERPASIFTDQFLSRRDDLKYIYKLVMLTDDKKTDKEERINRAFRYGLDELESVESVERFNKLILGGVEVLYERFIADAKVTEDMFNNFFSFLDEFNSVYVLETPIETGLFSEVE